MHIQHASAPMKNHVSLSDASNMLFDIIVDNIEKDVVVAASVSGKRATIYLGNRSNAIFTVHDTNLCNHLSDIEKKKNIPLSGLTFPADYMRSLITSCQPLHQFLEKDFKLLEAYMDDFIALEQPYDPSFVGHFGFVYAKDIDSYLFCLCRKVDAGMPIPAPSSTDGSSWNDFAVEDMLFYLAAASFSVFQEVFGNGVTVYKPGLFTNRLRTRKLALLAQLTT